MNYKSILKNTIGMASIILSVYLYGCSSAADPNHAANEAPVMQVLTLDSAAASTYAEYSATLQGKSDVEIRPQVEGYLEEIFVDEGAYVTAGQPLFRINDRPYTEQLNMAQATLNAAEAGVANAQLEIDKLTPLVQNKVVSDIQLKAAQAAYQAAKAQMAQAKATVASAKINLGFTLIKAPVNGFAGRLPKKIGSLVGRANIEPLTVISDVTSVHAYFSMSETDFLDFKARYAGKTLQEKISHMPAISLVLADNSVYPVKGKVDIIDGQFDKNTGAITFRASFANQQGLLRSGNTGKIRLEQVHTSVFLVPQQATVELQDKVFVFALNDSNKVQKQAIGITGKSGTDYLVKEGVTAGTRIVYTSLDRLQEGMIVTPKPIEKEKPVAISEK